MEERIFGGLRSTTFADVIQNLDIRNTYPLVMYTLLYLKQITNNDLLYSIWNSAQCYVATWMGGGLVVEWIHVYIWLSPFGVHLKLSHHH